VFKLVGEVEAVDDADRELERRPKVMRDGELDLVGAAEVVSGDVRLRDNDQGEKPALERRTGFTGSSGIVSYKGQL
jgi:hypothetical protein